MIFSVYFATHTNSTPSKLQNIKMSCSFFPMGSFNPMSPNPIQSPFLILQGKFDPILFLTLRGKNNLYLTNKYQKEEKTTPSLILSNKN